MCAISGDGLISPWYPRKGRAKAVRQNRTRERTHVTESVSVYSIISVSSITPFSFDELALSTKEVDGGPSETMGGKPDRLLEVVHNFIL